MYRLSAVTCASTTIVVTRVYSEREQFPVVIYFQVCTQAPVLFSYAYFRGSRTSLKLFGRINAVRNRKHFKNKLIGIYIFGKSSNPFRFAFHVKRLKIMIGF